MVKSLECKHMRAWYKEVLLFTAKAAVFYGVLDLILKHPTVKALVLILGGKDFAL